MKNRYSTSGQANERWKLLKWLPCLLLLLIGMSGCQQETLDKEEQEVSGQGVTYTFQLPANWKAITNYEEVYGRLAVFGAEDTRSKSGMSVLIFPKESAEQENFGETTRKELAQKNGYSNPEDVYMKEYTVNDNVAYKFTFQTQFNGAKKWAHYYCIFSEHGILQILYYSADDANYEDRVKAIDASIETVKETEFDEEEAQTATVESEEAIRFQSSNYEVTINGLATTIGEEESSLLVLRYSLKNSGDEAIAANSWEEKIQLIQDGELLKKGTLSKDAVSYELTELLDSGSQMVEPGKEGEGIVLYKLISEEATTLKLDTALESEQTSYTLNIPSSEK